MDISDRLLVSENEASDLEGFHANGLTPAVSSIHAGDLVIFDTAMFHGGCSAEDPSGLTGNGEDEVTTGTPLLIYTEGKPKQSPTTA